MYVMLPLLLGKRVPVINSFSKNINMRLPNNMERYILKCQDVNIIAYNLLFVQKLTSWDHHKQSNIRHSNESN